MLNFREELSCLPLTEGMPLAAIERLTKIATHNSYPAGRVLFNEAEQHDRIHIVCSGLVTLNMRVPGHDVQTILTLGRGDILAWSALLANGVMTTSAVATEEVVAIEFATDDLKALCDRDHEIGYHIMRQIAVSLSKRLLATRLQLLDLFRD